MNKMFCFVILHYMSIEETKAFVQNIQEHVKGEKEIIIVDNASPNGSGEYISSFYRDVKNVTVILNEENLGFAKGNNIGYRFAKEYFNPDFIILSNNDIEIPQADFMGIVEQIYQEERFAVLGPQIYSTNEQRFQSPKRLESYSYTEVEQEYEKYKKKRDSKLFVPIRTQLKKIPFLQHMVRQKREKNRDIDYNRVYINPILHGSFIIVSEQFIKTRSDAFYEGTHMYFETEILDYQCKQEGLKVLYSPQIKILHHHSVSTRKTFVNELKKVRFMNQQICNSLECYLCLMQEDGQVH